MCGHAGQVKKGPGRLTFRRALGSVYKNRLVSATHDDAPLASAGLWAAGAAWKGAGSTPQEAVGARGGAWPAWPAPFSVGRPWRPRVGSGFDAPKRRDLAWAGGTREFDQLCLWALKTDGINFLSCAGARAGSAGGEFFFFSPSLCARPAWRHSSQFTATWTTVARPTLPPPVAAAAPTPPPRPAAAARRAQGLA